MQRMDAALHHTLQKQYMRKYVLIIIVLIPFLSQAQWRLAVQAGANNTKLHQVEQSYIKHSGSSIGWQAGVYTDYRKHNWFYYSGVQLAHYNFWQNEVDNPLYKLKYHPYYLQLPVGIGYYLPLHKNIGLKMYGGVEGLLGIGGKATEPYSVECVTIPCPMLPNRLTNDIVFGKNSGNNAYENFSRVAANVQAGTAVTISNKIEAGIDYAWGITNARSKDDYYPGKAHLNSWDVNVKYYLHSK